MSITVALKCPRRYSGHNALGRADACGSDKAIAAVVSGRELEMGRVTGSTSGAQAISLGKQLQRGA